jgi:hypothetical protein
MGAKLGAVFCYTVLYGVTKVNKKTPENQAFSGVFTVFAAFAAFAYCSP